MKMMKTRKSGYTKHEKAGSIKAEKERQDSLHARVHRKRSASPIKRDYIRTESHIFLRKLYCICAAILGILILAFYTSLVRLSPNIAKSISVFVFAVLVYSIYDTIDTILNPAVHHHWKIYGFVSALLVWFAGFLLLAKQYSLDIELIKELSLHHPITFSILGVILVIDNVFWLMRGE
ncbi:MAG: hypothetical protein V1659_03235 [Candidatus Woesearchaeota archaeon]